MLWVYYFAMIFLAGVASNSDPFKRVDHDIPVEIEDEFMIAADGSFRESFMGKERSKKRLKNYKALWPMAVIVYKVTEDIGCPESLKCQQLMRVMDHYEQHTCIRFKEWSGETDYLSIKGSSQDKLTCSSFLGRIGGDQQVLLPNGCWNDGTIMHEFGHVLGFWDEHNRYDRDRWIKVFYENILPEAVPFFHKVPRNLINILGEPMDFDSVMMYSTHDFSKDKINPSFLPIHKGLFIERVHRRKELSAGDVRRLNKLYRCDGKNQKPRFPTDVTCSFDEHQCGFKGAGIDDEKKSWSWTRKKVSSSQDVTGGYLYSELETAKNFDAYIWTINFHGLSPIDKKRRRLGCISFSYVILVDEEASLKLFMTSLESPHQHQFDETNTHEIWKETAVKTENAQLFWQRVSIPIFVTKPFALIFLSKFMERTTAGSIRLDDFELKYTQCANPHGIVSEVDRQKSRHDVPRSRLNLMFARMSAFYQDYHHRRCLIDNSKTVPIEFL